MNQEELEGVLAHEISHIANGDMVTMTLLQGVVNAFVMFLSRVLAFAIAQAFRGEKERDRGLSHGSTWIIQFFLEFLFMILGSMLLAWFSRYREYRADAGGARLAGTGAMIRALERLQKTFEAVDLQAQPSVQAMKISGRRSGILALFATHPALEDRIARLKLS
jgi:heat shock protein HtpX